MVSLAAPQLVFSLPRAEPHGGVGSGCPMAAAIGEGPARTPILPAGAALALLGVLVYLGALCAACRRYALPAAPLPSLPVLGMGSGTPWWHLAVGTPRVCLF